MNLRPTHAKILASLDDLNYFEQLREIRDLRRETREMDLALGKRMKAILLKLERQGFPISEAAEKSGIPEATLHRAIVNVRLAPDEGARE